MPIRETSSGLVSIVYTRGSARISSSHLKVQRTRGGQYAGQLHGESIPTYRKANRVAVRIGTSRVVPEES
jgi:hypothetical protein